MSIRALFLSLATLAGATLLYNQHKDRLSAQRTPASLHKESRTINRWPQSVTQNYRADLLTRLNRDRRYVQRFPASLARVEVADCTVLKSERKLKHQEFKTLYKNHQSQAAETFKQCAKEIYKRTNKTAKLNKINQDSKSETGIRALPPTTTQTAQAIPTSAPEHWGADQESIVVDNIVTTLNTSDLIPQSADENTRTDIVNCIVDKAKSTYSADTFNIFTKTSEGVLGQFTGECAEQSGLLVNKTALALKSSGVAPGLKMIGDSIDRTSSIREQSEEDNSSRIISSVQDNTETESTN